MDTRTGEIFNESIAMERLEELALSIQLEHDREKHLDIPPMPEVRAEYLEQAKQIIKPMNVNPT